MGLLSSLVSAKIKKMGLDQEKAQKQLEASTVNKGIMELISQNNPEEAENVSQVVEAIGNNNPDASKLVYKSIEQRIKDKTDFQQTLQLEKYKAGTAAVTETIKQLAKNGGMSPEQLQAIQAESADRVYKSLGISDMATKINQSTQQTQSQPQVQPTQGDAPNNGVNDFFAKPIEPQKSNKQRDYDSTLQHGLAILDETERQYKDISEKYGTGRVLGQFTKIRGGLGDLLPKGQQAPEVVPYQNNLEGLANFIGKTVYRDERVSDVNLKGYKKALAELTNTPDEAQIMFSTLRKYAQTKDIKQEMALRLMLPKDGKGLMPSEAIKKISGKNPFEHLSREEKIALLKKKQGSQVASTS